MDQENNKKQSMENKEYDKIYIGTAIIALSPVLGSLLFYGYTIKGNILDVSLKNVILPTLFFNIAII